MPGALGKQRIVDLIFMTPPGPNNTVLVISFRQLYQETVSDLQTELKAALVDLGHKSAFDLLLKEAWNPEQAAMGNSTRQDV